MAKKKKKKHRVVRTIPRIWDLPQCAATREGVYANDTPETDKQCKRRAKVMFDNKPLCLRHAEVVALRIMLGEEKLSDV